MPSEIVGAAKFGVNVSYNSRVGRPKNQIIWNAEALTRLVGSTLNATVMV